MPEPTTETGPSHDVRDTCVPGHDTAEEHVAPMTRAGDEALTATFRDVMAGVATPVSVVTTMAGERPHGTTVSAFASLSMTPPMVLASLDRGSDLLAGIRAHGRFGLNVLGSHQAALALTFARKGQSKFDGVPWAEDLGVPRLEGAPGWLACVLAELIDGGDHVIALGHVVGARTVAAAPLTYHSRAFGTHAALEVLR
jgi:flavin reductase (DIM6/NTAB) family NADH-FMN oxidoreductase RutF